MLEQLEIMHNLSTICHARVKYNWPETDYLTNNKMSKDLVGLFASEEEGFLLTIRDKMKFLWMQSIKRNVQSSAEDYSSPASCLSYRR